MTDPRSVLVVDDGTDSARDVVARLRHLGLETHVAEAAERSRAVFDAEAERIGLVFVAASGFGPELGSFLEYLRTQRIIETPGIVAVGPAPDESVRAALREAGVDRALWEPYDDGTLRFIVNEELLEEDEFRARGEQRVPTTLLARVEVGGRLKDALVYNLSVTGAYLETPRPSMRGARLVLELPIPDGDVRVGAEVVYTNVPGNLQRSALPLGMGVRFLAVEAEATDRLRRYVEDRARRFQV